MQFICPFHVRKATLKEDLVELLEEVARNDGRAESLNRLFPEINYSCSEHDPSGFLDLTPLHSESPAKAFNSENWRCFCPFFLASLFFV